MKHRCKTVHQWQDKANKWLNRRPKLQSYFLDRLKAIIYGLDDFLFQFHGSLKNCRTDILI